MKGIKLRNMKEETKDEFDESDLDENMQVKY